MIQWEYKTEAPAFGIWLAEHEFLGQNGEQGWELVAINFTYSPARYYFKRPLSTAEKIFNEVKNEVEGGHMEVKTTS
jgi:hypothetical protein